MAYASKEYWKSRKSNFTSVLIVEVKEKKMVRVKRDISFLFTFCLVLGGLVFQTSAQSGSSDELAGTFELDVQNSEKVSDVVGSATRNTQITSSDKEDLTDKLEAPETIAIDVRGNSVTVAASGSEQITFIADGSARSMTGANGSSVRVRASLRGNELIVSSIDGETDYTITFTATNNGNGLRITRRVTTDYLRYTVFADSVYNKTGAYSATKSPSKDDAGYSSSDRDNNTNGSTASPTTRRISSGVFVVPKGEILTGAMLNLVSTKDSQNNDRFRMKVQSPNEFEGAIIEGYLSGVKRTGNIKGRSTLTLNFETIQMRDGKTYDFAGLTKTATDSTGRVIRVGKEGDIQGKSRSKKSAKRGGIGAGLGAILGGILGGGKGAIIGATIGGSAGAGSVIAKGKGDVTLEEGSILTVESTSPNK